VGELLRAHEVVVRGPRVTLRPLTEDDWPVLCRWNADPEVLSFADGNDRDSYSPDEVKGIYRKVSETAFCFMIEAGGRPIGECWLQRMNLPEILERHPRLDLRRIDIAIGEKSTWGGGLGAEAIGLLVRFGFEGERADEIYGCGIWSRNPRSLVAFAKHGFEVDEWQPVEGHGGEGSEYNLFLARDVWTRFHAGARPLVVRKAGTADREAMLSILTEAAEWLLARGLRQWEAHVSEPGHLEERVDEAINAGTGWIAEMEGEAAGTFILSGPRDRTCELWPDASPNERYLFKLAVRRAFAGRGLGIRLLRRAEVLAIAQGATAIRLDCVATGPEPALPRYYAGAGYSLRGMLEAHGWRLAQFERVLGA